MGRGWLERALGSSTCVETCGSCKLCDDQWNSNITPDTWLAGRLQSATMHQPASNQTESLTPAAPCRPHSDRSDRHRALGLQKRQEIGVNARYCDVAKAAAEAVIVNILDVNTRRQQWEKEHLARSVHRARSRLVETTNDLNRRLGGGRARFTHERA
jgi:hypothetical protein